MLARRFGAPDPLDKLRRRGAEIDELLLPRSASGGPSRGEDILSLLLAARFEDGEPMADAEVRDQLVTLCSPGTRRPRRRWRGRFDLLLRTIRPRWRGSATAPTRRT